MYNIYVKKSTIKKMNRSKSIPCDICGEKTFLDCHHIGGRKIPNPNHKNNLAQVCPSCHRKIHEGEIIIEGWFLTTKGMELIWHNQGEVGISDQEIIPFIIPK